MSPTPLIIPCCTISLQATMPESFLASVKYAKQHSMSIYNVDTTMLDVWQAMSVRRLINEADSYYVLHGQGNEDFFIVQGNQLTLRSTVPYNAQMLFLLKQMLESVASEYNLEVENE